MKYVHRLNVRAWPESYRPLLRDHYWCHHVRVKMTPSINQGGQTHCTKNPLSGHLEDARKKTLEKKAILNYDHTNNAIFFPTFRCPSPSNPLVWLSRRHGVWVLPKARALGWDSFGKVWICTLGPGLQGYPPIISHTVDGRNPKQPPGINKTLWTMGFPPLSAGAGFRPSTVWKLGTLEPCRHVQLRDGFSQRNGGRMTDGFSTMKLMNPKIQLKCQVHFLWAFTDSYGWVSTPTLRFLKSLIKLLAWKHHDFGC